MEIPHHIRLALASMHTNAEMILDFLGESGHSNSILSSDDMELAEQLEQLQNDITNIQEKQGWIS